MQEQTENVGVVASSEAGVTKKAPDKEKPKIKYRIIGEIDRPLLIVIIALVCIGSVMVFSASYATAETRFGDSYYFARKQIRWVIIGLIVMGVIAKLFSYKILKGTLAYIFYFFTLLLNIIVPFFGVTKNGATRWFNIFGVEFQPSELLKFALVLAMATFISNNAKHIKDFKKGTLRLIFLAIPAAFATFFQNHLSATIIVIALVFIMLWLSGTKASYLLIAIAALAVLGVLMFTAGRPILQKFVPQVFDRLQVWQDPFSYMSYESGGKGWQPAQSLYAISSGGFWGLGLGQSNQKHGYLPEPQNDYIFAILAEELGLFGVICVICLFAYLAYRGFHVSKNAPDRFSSLLSFGIIAHVTMQAILNLAVVTNTIPSTGISLPFFSYGGTSLVMLLAEMGVVLSISRYSFVEQG